MIFILIFYMFYLCFMESNSICKDEIDNQKIKNIIKQNINILEFPIDELIIKLSMLKTKYSNLESIYNDDTMANYNKYNTEYIKKKEDIKNINKLITEYQRQMDNIKV